MLTNKDIEQIGQIIEMEIETQVMPEIKLIREEIVNIKKMQVTADSRQNQFEYEMRQLRFEFNAIVMQLGIRLDQLELGTNQRTN
jgi:hypothetical protein